jgi:hypothetical protein
MHKQQAIVIGRITLAIMSHSRPSEFFDTMSDDPAFEIDYQDFFSLMASVYRSKPEWDHQRSGFENMPSVCREISSYEKFFSPTVLSLIDGGARSGSSYDMFSKLGILLKSEIALL